MAARVRGCLIGAVVAGGLAVLVVAVATAVLLRRGGEPPPSPAPSPSPRALRVLEEKRLDERRMELRLRSQALEAETGVRLLLPEGWSKDAGRTWPVLWLLHGGLDGYTAWTAKTDVDRLTRGDDVIVVMPDGGRCGSYSDWWNGGRGGPPRWETYHLKELLPLLEARYRAGPRRAVAGYSMGGQGAMLYAAKGHFKAAASFSGALHILQPGVPQAVMAGTALGCFGTDWRRIWGDPERQRAIWRAHNPYDQVARLRGVRLYVAAGDGDLVEQLANRAARAFAERAREEGIDVRTHFTRGGHNHDTWQRELHRAYPMLLSALR
ncbi:alpha/beta hydrolase [Thermoactinospora rubra]|uniref:alpha/beta hydrolase n=1 Tax=Thermoactinospora rubra TaxID=1088767 RepID=UPI000A10A826|nr:alpha/beta hydrolase family protein [Thermoactinospora rubra]